MGSKSLARFALAVVALAGLMGCDAMPPELEGKWLRLQRAWNGEPRVSVSPAASTSPSPAARDLEPSPRVRGAKANAELLHEVYQVVFGREPKDRGEFGSLVDSMNQGASLEGMYNGFVHSVSYRRMEASGTSASPEALRAFGEELAVFEAEFPTPIEFDRHGVAVPPSVADGVKVIEYGKTLPSARPSLSETYSRQFVGASSFTLKRLLGNEALRVIALKRDYPEKLALWYSRWVVHMAHRKVDYGIFQRNQADEAFHYKWALTAGEDRIAWEVLNRVHRALNEANRPKQ